MGSKSDLPWSEKIAEALDKLGVQSVLRIASAHKVPLKCHELIKGVRKRGCGVLSQLPIEVNALSGFTDAQTCCPVIACPPYGDKFGGADIYSSLRMPSGVCPVGGIRP